MVMKWWDTHTMQEADDVSFERGTTVLVDDNGKELIGLGVDGDGAPLMWVDDEVRQLLDRLHRVGVEGGVMDTVTVDEALEMDGLRVSKSGD